MSTESRGYRKDDPTDAPPNDSLLAAPPNDLLEAPPPPALGSNAGDRTNDGLPPAPDRYDASLTNPLSALESAADESDAPVSIDVRPSPPDLLGFGLRAALTLLLCSCLSPLRPVTDGDSLSRLYVWWSTAEASAPSPSRAGG